MAYLFGTGFEGGHVNAYFDASVSANVYQVQSSTKHSGTYAGLVYENFGASQGWLKLPSNMTEVYISAWILLNDNGQTGRARFGVRLTDGTTIVIAPNHSQIPNMHAAWVANVYVNGNLVATGTYWTHYYDWVHLDLYVKVADASGRVTTRMNGVADVDYTGDTQPSSSGSAAGWVGAHATGGLVYFDDVVVADNAYPGGIMLELLTPTGDSGTVEWVPSTGTAHYALVDEIPYNDSDYVSSGSNAKQELWTMVDWTATNKAAKFVMAWLRGKKETPDATDLKFLLNTSSLNTGTGVGLTTAFQYFWKMYDSDPADAAEWTGSKINSIQLGAESVIP